MESLNIEKNGITFQKGLLLCGKGYCLFPELEYQFGAMRAKIVMKSNPQVVNIYLNENTLLLRSCLKIDDNAMGGPHPSFLVNNSCIIKHSDLQPSGSGQSTKPRNNQTILWLESSREFALSVSSKIKWKTSAFAKNSSFTDICSYEFPCKDNKIVLNVSDWPEEDLQIFKTKLKTFSL